MVYNRLAMTRFTIANADDVNRELSKIQAAIAEQDTILAAIEAETGAARFTWTAWADSADGTTNFSNSAPGSRTYIGWAFNKTTATRSAFAEDYTWSRFRGADGEDATYVEYRFRRSWSKPSTPSGAAPSGWTTDTPSGSERLWSSHATLQGAEPTGPWSVPVSIDGVILRGVYAAATTYYANDAVTYGGGTYRAKKTTVGHVPSGNANANTYWDVIAAPGSAGTPSSPPSGSTLTLNLTSTSVGVNLRTFADANGYLGGDATIGFVVQSGITVQGAEGSYGIDTGVWPSGYTIALTLTVQSGGKVYGGGGSGGDGGSYAAAGAAGDNGGDAITCNQDITVTINSGGEVKAGGGGGGGGRGSLTGGWPEPFFLGGGGGGGGFPNGTGGTGGAGDTAGTVGSNATTGGGGAGGAGAGGAGAGGAGGGAAADGTAGASTGGAAGVGGYAVRKNGKTVPVTNNGTMTGTAA
jgi:hypothetical protein